MGAERPATLATLERQLLLVNELPGVQAAVRIFAFSDVGTALGDRVTPVNPQ